VLVCLLRSLGTSSWRSVEPEDEDVGGEYREFDTEEPDCQ
jgi:hypothetical protein